jgi:hypothetical protein
MKILANDFNIIQGDNPVIQPGRQRASGNSGNSYPIIRYPCNIPDPTQPGSFVDYTIPAGSRIKIEADFNRPGRGRKCDGRRYQLDLNLTSSQEYENFKEWWDGDNVEARLGDW